MVILVSMISWKVIKFVYVINKELWIKLNCDK